jgi:ParB family chromosome partitioning protein
MLEASLTERHARALLKIEDLSLRSSILDIVIKNSLNVSQTELLIEETLCKEEEKKNPPDIKKHNKLIPKDLRLFFNSINHAIKSMQQAGIKVVSEQKRTDGFIEFTIRIPESKN